MTDDEAEEIRRRYISKGGEVDREGLRVAIDIGQLIQERKRLLTMVRMLRQELIQTTDRLSQTKRALRDTWGS